MAIRDYSQSLMYVFGAVRNCLFACQPERLTLNSTECDTVYETLQSHLDWIDTTQSLSNVTIPILETV